MPVVHHFAHGPINPAAAYALAFLGAVLALACTARARAATTGSRRARWLVTAAFALGGGIWLMHFTAMLGFDVPESPVRYDAATTLVSAVLAVAVVGCGLGLVGSGRRAAWKIILGGGFTGVGVAAMHYTGMAAMRIAGFVEYDLHIVGASVLIAVVAAIVALWLSVTVRGRGPIIVSGLIMALAVCGMHYTGMAALRVELITDGAPVAGIDPIALVLPIVVSATAALVALVFGALQTVTQEDFAQPASGPFRGVAAPPRGPHPVPLTAFNTTMRVPASSTMAGHDRRR
jgi:NO-binding membrane sensor protein with MHYT domain